MSTYQIRKSPNSEDAIVTSSDKKFTIITDSYYFLVRFWSAGGKKENQYYQNVLQLYFRMLIKQTVYIIMIRIRIAKSCIKGKLNLTKIMQVYHSKFQYVWVKFNSPLFRRTSFSTYLKSVWTEFNASIWNVKRLSS